MNTGQKFFGSNNQIKPYLYVLEDINKGIREQGETKFRDIK